MHFWCYITTLCWCVIKLNKTKQGKLEEEALSLDCKTRHFPLICYTIYTNLCRSLDFSRWLQDSSSLVVSGPWYSNCSIVHASTDSPRARSARNGRPVDISSGVSCIHINRLQWNLIKAPPPYHDHHSRTTYSHIFFPPGFALNFHSITRSTQY